MTFTSPFILCVISNMSVTHRHSCFHVGKVGRGVDISLVMLDPVSVNIMIISFISDFFLLWEFVYRN